MHVAIFNVFLFLFFNSGMNTGCRMIFMLELGRGGGYLKVRLLRRTKIITETMNIKVNCLYLNNTDRASALLMHS